MTFRKVFYALVIAFTFFTMAPVTVFGSALTHTVEHSDSMTFTQALGGFSYKIVDPPDSEAYRQNKFLIDSLYGRKVIDELEKSGVEPHSVVSGIIDQRLTWDDMRNAFIADIVPGTDSSVTFLLTQDMKRSIAQALKSFTASDLSTLGWTYIGNFNYPKTGVYQYSYRLPQPAKLPSIKYSTDKFYVRVVSNKAFGDSTNLVPNIGPQRALLVGGSFKTRTVNSTSELIQSYGFFADSSSSYYNDRIKLINIDDDFYDYEITFDYAALASGPSSGQYREAFDVSIDEFNVRDVSDTPRGTLVDVDFYYKEGSLSGGVTKEQIFGDRSPNQVFNDIDNNYVDDVEIGYNPDWSGLDVPAWGDGLLGNINSLLRDLIGLIIPSDEDIEGFLESVRGFNDQLIGKLTPFLDMVDVFGRAFDNSEDLIGKTFSFNGLNVHFISPILADRIVSMRPFITGAIVFFIIVTLYKRITGSGDVINS